MKDTTSIIVVTNHRRGKYIKVAWHHIDGARKLGSQSMAGSLENTG